MIFRRLIAASALLCASVLCAHAQIGSVKTPSQLNSEVNSTYPDNTQGQITPFGLRQVSLDQVASVPFLNFANTFLQLQTFSLGITVAGTFTAPSLVTNADLANPGTTVNGVSCVLGSTCTVTATASSTLTFGTHLTAGGTSYNGSAPVTISSDATNANTASAIVARDASGNFSAGTITASLTGHASLDLATSALGTGVQTALGNNTNASGGICILSPTRAGDILYWNGSACVSLAGNNSGTQAFTENASGVPAWATLTGSGTVTSVATSGLATGGPITTTGTVTVTAAVQSDQRTGTSNAVAVTPGTQVFSDSAIKYECLFNGTTVGGSARACDFFGYGGPGGAPTVVRVSAGIYTLNFPTAFASGNPSPSYGCTGSLMNNTTGLFMVGGAAASQGTTSTNVEFLSTAGAPTDGTPLWVVCSGRQ